MHTECRGRPGKLSSWDTSGQGIILSTGHAVSYAYDEGTLGKMIVNSIMLQTQAGSKTVHDRDAERRAAAMPQGNILPSRPFAPERNGPTGQLGLLAHELVQGPLVGMLMHNAVRDVLRNVCSI